MRFDVSYGSVERASTGFARCIPPTRLDLSGFAGNSSRGSYRSGGVEDRVEREWGFDGGEEDRRRVRLRVEGYDIWNTVVQKTASAGVVLMLWRTGLRLGC